MIAADSSVAVPAALPWHEAHSTAAAAVADGVLLPAHAAVETFSVLTRLAPPHRLPPGIATGYLEETFAGELLTLSARGHRELFERAAADRIAGGAIYDGLVAATALEHGATLLTLDRRAERVYRLVGVDFRVL